MTPNKDAKSEGQRYHKSANQTMIQRWNKSFGQAVSQGASFPKSDTRSSSRSFGEEGGEQGRKEKRVDEKRELEAWVRRGS